MEAVKSYRITDTSAPGEEGTRPDIYVQFDKERVELRRPKGSRSVDEFLVELSLEEARQLCTALVELLPRRGPTDLEERHERVL